MSATTAREALDAMFVPGSDTDQAEFTRRVNAVVAEALGSVPDFFQPGHGYTHRDGTDFRCVAVTTHPNTGERRALGWIVRNGWHEPGSCDPDDWTHNYDGCEPPAGESTQSPPGQDEAARVGMTARKLRALLTHGSSPGVTRRTEYALQDAGETPYPIGARDHREAALVAAGSPGSQIVHRTVTTTTGPWTKAGEAR